MFALRSRLRRPALCTALLALCVTSCLPPGGPACVAPDGWCGPKTTVCMEPTVWALARDLDDLERHIDKYGSIVAKVPDVWGQARLTKHREDFEKQMNQDLGKFAATLQGSLARTDQAYFANAFALSAAVSSQGAYVRPPRVQVNNGTSAGNTNSNNAPPPSPGTPIAVPGLPDQSSTFAAFDTITRNAANLPKPMTFAYTSTGISLEPTVLEEQKARFLYHLNELRRINEGDDTADSPGYALNLVRIPVSVLPGKCTDIGYGAEVTMTLTPNLTDELLPTTFRNLVLNDVVDQISFPLTQFMNDPCDRQYLTTPGVHRLIEEVNKPGGVANLQEVLANLVARYPGLRCILARPEWREALEDPPADPSLQRTPTARSAVVVRTAMRRSFRVPIHVPATKSRRARMPFPPSELVDVYGYDWVYHIAEDAFRIFSQERPSRPCPDACGIYIHLPDVQGYLQEEVAAAYKFLSQPGNLDLWRFCTPELVAAVRSHQADRLAAMQTVFGAAVAEKVQTDQAEHDALAALAWAIIVESALLNDQLVTDMRESASLKGCACGNAGELPYFLPNPPPEARAAFNDYVRCRWPIHVFALDPVTQQQNIADVFSARREMQLAMSLAFVSGQISARNMMRYARRIELDAQTIDLNNTAVGFSHGDETFGWRFYPRYQTPDIESNATVFFRDLLVGGPSRNALLRQRRLEPGIRECEAVIIMPSFVPYATLNVSGNWFKITNPKCKELNLTQAMRLSRAVKAIQGCSGQVFDADCYRDGDLARLMARGKQLEDRLPLQTLSVQVPYENTLGGFAMFNTGVTDLAPELTGWYGSPSIKPDEPTTLFLVGNHFSVIGTKVIAGGQEVQNQEMLSRQVIKVVIPGGTVQLGTGGERFVDIQLATPYGVTQHLLVPVCPKPADGAPAPAPCGTPIATSTRLAEVPAAMPLAPDTPVDNNKLPLPAPPPAPATLPTPPPASVPAPTIEVGPPPKPLCPSACAPAPAYVPAKAPTWAAGTVEIAFIYSGLGIAASADPRLRSPNLTLNLTAAEPLNFLTAAVKLTFSGGASVQLTYNPADSNNRTVYDPQKRTLTFDTTVLADALFKQLDRKFGPEATNPPQALTAAKATLTFTTGGAAPPPPPATIANALQVQWVHAPR